MLDGVDIALSDGKDTLLTGDIEGVPSTVKRERFSGTLFDGNGIERLRSFMNSMKK